MRITDVEVKETTRGTKLAATFVWNDRRRRADRIHFIYRDVPAGALATPGDALLAAALVPAVILREDVVLDVPVSARLLGAAPAIVDYFVSHNRRWHRSRVDAPSVDRSGLTPTEIAAPLSGGVDSFYTALRPREEPITLLISVLGLDYAHIVERSEPRMQQLSKAAEEMSKKHLIVESNAYLAMLDHLPWTGPRGMAILGSLVIGQALALGSCIRRLCVPSAGTIVAFEGTHPNVDHRWSTESLTVVHDAAVPRFEKALAIASVPAVLEGLQVCARPRQTIGNCGRCSKCVCTALAFEVAGTIDRCRTLERVTPKKVRATNVEAGWAPTFERVLERTTDPDMREAIARALRKGRLRERGRKIGTVLRWAGFRRGPRY